MLTGFIFGDGLVEHIFEKNIMDSNLGIILYDINTLLKQKLQKFFHLKKKFLLIVIIVKEFKKNNKYLLILWNIF